VGCGALTCCSRPATETSHNTPKQLRDGVRASSGDPSKLGESAGVMGDCLLLADCAIQTDVFTNELAGDLRPKADGCPSRSRAVHPTEPRFIAEHDAQVTAPLGGSPHESVLSRNVAFGMEWTRHGVRRL
jgi:hypothetical protein